MQLIGIAGQRGVGKDTVGQFLVEDHNYHLIKMADYLKNMLRTLLRDAGLSLSEIERRIEGDLKAAPMDILFGKSVRDAMMFLGTEWRDLIHTELWTRLTFSRIVTLQDSGIQRIVITDIRFPHEVDMVHQFNGRVVKVERPGFENDVAHASENLVAALKSDFTIVNDCDLATLRSKVGLLASISF